MPMDFVINKAPAVFEQPAPMHHYESLTFLYEVMPAASIECTSNTGITVPRLPIAKRNEIRPTGYSLAFQAMRYAAAAGLPLSLRPEIVWYWILHELGSYIRQQGPGLADRLRPRWSHTMPLQVAAGLPIKRQPTWQDEVRALRDPLRSQFSDWQLQVFLPDFSTTTEADDLPLLLAFCSQLRPRARPRALPVRHIPGIRLAGTHRDWYLLLRAFEGIYRSYPGLHALLERLHGILSAIVDSSIGIIDPGFWQEMFHHTGDQAIRGWIQAFVTPVNDAATTAQAALWQQRVTALNELPSHLASSRFMWDQYEPDYKMSLVGGITGIDFTDGYLEPRLGAAIAEL